MTRRRRLRRHPSQVQLEAWFDGEADDDVAWHVLGCDRCYCHLGGTARLRAGLRAVLRDSVGLTPAHAEGRSVRPDDDGVRAVHTRAAVRTTAPDSVGATRVRTPLVPAAVAATVLVLGVGGVLAGPLRATVMSGFTRASSSDSGQDGQSPHTRQAGASVRNGNPDAAPGQGSGNAHGAAGRASATPPGPTPRGSDSATASAAGSTLNPQNSGSTGPLSVTATGNALRLAVVTADAGPGAADASAVRQAAASAVVEANSTGGVGGVPVQLVDVPAQDAAALAGLPGHVDALVGGFGASAPARVSWLLPADPAVTGSEVVGADPTDRQAGAQLASALLAQGFSGPVGVVSDGGPDSDLATGIAQQTTVDTVPVPPQSSCLSAADQLRRAGVVALAVAGSPDMAASCLAAAQAMSWQPPGGVLVAPSAVYAGLGSSPAAAAVSNVRSVLGFPWPTASQSGARRFRSAVPGATSYRALVTFAAVELAVDVARADSSLDPAAMGKGLWRNDLFDYAGLVNAGAHVVEANGGGWVPAP